MSRRYDFSNLLLTGLKKYDDICENIFFVRSKSSLRGHQLKLHKESVRLDVAKYSFRNRVNLGPPNIS